MTGDFVNLDIENACLGIRQEKKSTIHCHFNYFLSAMLLWQAGIFNSRHEVQKSLMTFLG